MYNVHLKHTPVDCNILYNNCNCVVNFNVCFNLCNNPFQLFVYIHTVTTSEDCWSNVHRAQIILCLTMPSSPSSSVSSADPFCTSPDTCRAACYSQTRSPAQLSPTLKLQGYQASSAASQELCTSICQSLMGRGSSIYR